MPLLTITLVVMTYNEAANIARCLDSVPFAAEKLVVDSGSTDATVTIAQAHGARVEHQDWLGFGAQRNTCSTLAGHDWILVLDADEYLSPELARELESRLPQVMASSVAAGILRRTTLFMGAPMRWYRPMVGERMARLYHRDRARWADVRVHESLRFDGASVAFDAPFHHLHNPTLVHKSLKVVRYSELKARDWLQKRRAPRMWLCPFVFAAAFVKDYVFRLAMLDGWRGYVVAQTAASYAVYKRMRLYEMVRNPASIAAADALLARHGLERQSNSETP
jgi:glycosyltransferase involved in cell wall biosynthesis